MYERKVSSGLLRDRSGKEMQTWIALFRGINVGGNNVIKMADLKALCGTLGLEGAQTYIQSGNLVFRSNQDAVQLRQALKSTVHEHAGFEPNVICFPADHLKKAMESNPFSEGEADPKSLHLYFLDEVPSSPDLVSLKQYAKPDSEQFRLLDDVFYLHAPEGIGRSKLAASAEKALGVGATARNWRTVLKLSEMAAAYSG